MNQGGQLEASAHLIDDLFFAQVVDHTFTPDSPGRALDFLAQELGREANTIASKSLDVDIAHAVVEIKARIERLREQAQNVE